MLIMYVAGALRVWTVTSLIHVDYAGLRAMRPASYP